MIKKLTAMFIAMLLLVSCSAAEKPLTATALLDLGEKYLLELDYEQALVQFTKVIEIEPMNPRGYTGAAEAYIALSETEKAIEILQRGQELLPDDNDINSMLNEQSSASGEPVEDSSTMLWDSYNEEQKTMLDTLEQAAENFDYEAVYDIMTSTEFIDLYSELVIDPESRSRGEAYNFNEEWTWILSYWDANGENHNEKDYWWIKRNSNSLEIECQLWLLDVVPPYIAIRHMSLINNEENGPFEMIEYSPSPEFLMLTHYEGTALNRLHTGSEIVTDLLEGSVWVFEYNDQGMITNYLMDEDGEPYVLSDDGRRKWAPLDHALQASTIH